MTGKYVELCHRYLYEQLHDEQWHPLEPLLVQMMRWVPPGVAMRRTKGERQANRKRREQAGTPISTASPAASWHATDLMLRVGARRVAWDIVGATKGPYETKQQADGTALVRLLRTPAVIRGDRNRAEQLRPAFDGLADHFTAVGLPDAAEQIQLTAHEFGFHLRTCPADCSLTRRTSEALRRVKINDSEENDE